MWTLMLPAALAAGPYVLSAEVDRVVGELRTLTPETCVPALEAAWHDLEHLRPEEVDPADLAAHGGDTIRAVFDARLVLQERLRAMVDAGTLNPACMRSLRRADLAGRYLADYLYGVLPAEVRPDPWLVNPAFDFPSWEEGLQSGDILVTRADAISSAGIAHMGRIDSQFSHNVLVRRDPKSGKLTTVEAYLELGTISQTVEHLLEDGVDRVVVLRHRDRELAARVAEAAWDRVEHGKPIDYDADFALDDHSGLFCSEVPRWAYGELAGKPGDVPIPMALSVFEKDRNPGLYDAMGIEGDVTSAPADILFDPRFDIVAEWRDVQGLPALRHKDALVESLMTWMEEDGYAIHPRRSDERTVKFALGVRRFPLLGAALKGRIHPRGDEQFMVVSLGLQNAALALQDDFEAAIADRPEPIPYRDLTAVLDRLREEDLARWNTAPETAHWHDRLHPTGEPLPPQPTRLVVEVVVDQLPVRLLDNSRDLFTQGLARLTGPEAWVGVARHTHALTFTCPGHATISTGAAPSVSGIPSNDWFDAATGESTYCADARFLRVGTLADRVAESGGAVVALSLKDRAAMMLGGNWAVRAWYDKQAGRFTPPFDDLDAAPWLDQPWTALHPDAYAERVGPDANPIEHDAGLGTTFPHPPASTAPKAFLATPFAAGALVDAAIAAVDRLDLGADVVPDLLAVSFSNIDYVGHAHTAESWEALDAMVRLDADLGRLFEHLDREVGVGRYTVVLTADHGSTRTGGLRLSYGRIAEVGTDALHAAGFDGEVTFEDPSVWLPAAVRDDPAKRAPAAAAVAAAIASVPGIAGAWAWRDAGVDGPWADAIRLSLDEQRSGDVYVMLAEGALYDWPGSEGTGTSHGTPYDDDARVPLLAWGAGVHPGTGTTDADVRQIAPTIASWLGVPPPGAATLPPIEALRP